jgi:hypothetical protein
MSETLQWSLMISPSQKPLPKEVSTNELLHFLLSQGFQMMGSLQCWRYLPLAHIQAKPSAGPTESPAAPSLRARSLLPPLLVSHAVSMSEDGTTPRADDVTTPRASQGAADESSPRPVSRTAAPLNAGLPAVLNSPKRLHMAVFSGSRAEADSGFADGLTSLPSATAGHASNGQDLVGQRTGSAAGSLSAPDLVARRLSVLDEPLKESAVTLQLADFLTEPSADSGALLQVRLGLVASSPVKEHCACAVLQSKMTACIWHIAVRLLILEIIV